MSKMTFDLYDLRPDNYGRERRYCGHVDGKGLNTIYGASPIAVEDTIVEYGQTVINNCIVVVAHGSLPPWEK